MKRYLLKVFLEHFAFGLTISVSVVWMLSRGMSLVDVAIIEALALGLGLIIDIPTGWISDKFGRKLTLAGADIFHAAAFLLFAFSHDFWQFLLAAVVQAVGFALMSGAEEAYIYESQPGDYRKVFSNVNVVDEAATIVGLLCAPLLIAQFGLQAVFVVAAGVVLASTFVTGLLLQDTARQTRNEAEKQSRDKLKVWALVRKHAPLLMLFAVLAVYYEGGRVFWQPQLVATGFHVEQLGYLFAAFKVASLVGAYAGRHQKFSPKKEIVILGGLLAVSFILIASPIQALVLTGFFLYFFLENVYRIVESNYLQAMASDSRRAAFLSAASLTRQGYSVVAIPLLGFAAVANLTYVFYILAGLQAVAAAAFWVISRSRG